MPMKTDKVTPDVNTAMPQDRKNHLPSHRSLPFLLHNSLHGFPGLFTDTSEHIRFFTFSVFPLLAVGSVTYVSF